MNVKRYDELIAAGNDWVGISEVEDGDYVKFEDYASLQQKLDVVTADNFGLSSAAYTLLQMLNEPEGLSDAIARMEKALENPATDAHINALRAEGVDYVAEAVGAKCAELKVGSKDWKALKNIVFILGDFAAQLRNGEVK